MFWCIWSEILRNDINDLISDSLANVAVGGCDRIGSKLASIKLFFKKLLSGWKKRPEKTFHCAGYTAFALPPSPSVHARIVLHQHRTFFAPAMVVGVRLVKGRCSAQISQFIAWACNCSNKFHSRAELRAMIGLVGSFCFEHRRNDWIQKFTSELSCFSVLPLVKCWFLMDSYRTIKAVLCLQGLWPSIAFKNEPHPLPSVYYWSKSVVDAKVLNNPF